MQGVGDDSFDLTLSIFGAGRVRSVESHSLVITFGDGSLPRSTELLSAGIKAAANSNIGRSDASSREYRS